VLSIGFALSFNAMVGSIVLEVLNSGALSRPVDVLTFAGYFQTVRLLGGEASTALMQHFLPLREQFHSNILGLGVQLGLLPTDQRLLGLSAGVSSRTTGTANAVGRAAEIIALQVKQQAFTLAIADAFQLVAWSAIACLFVIACMARVPMQYRQIVSTPAPSA
jgi:DHA2 family multidrug resistance protein